MRIANLHPQATVELIDEAEAARRLGLSIHTLRADRVGDRRIPFVKMGRAVRYRPDSLIEMIEQCTVGGSVAAR